ncbi:MAG: extracellular solute-binding protein [Clostridia bacterium]|nr:extracellular solute-binding protein [Clostridia bacterium]
MRKRLLSLLMILCLVCAGQIALAETSVTLTMAGFDGDSTYRTWSDNAFFARMAERTDVAFSFRQYADAQVWQDAKTAMRAGDSDLPDVLFKADLSRAESERLFENGVLLDLTDWIGEYCPNLSALLDAHPEYREQITLPGGQIVALPFISTVPSQNCMWINRKWLNTLKLETPTDLESLERVLRAFRDRDPNQNGRQDEIPLSFLGSFDLKFLAHAFGLIINDYNLCAEGDRAVFVPATDQYRVFAEWCVRMNEEKLFDQDAYYTSDTVRAVTDSSQKQRYGVLLNTTITNLIPSDWLSDYEVLMPLAFEGTRRYRSLSGGLTYGTFAVTTACEDPAAALRWVDYLYSDEGARLASIGQENVDYLVDGDGTWRLTERVSQNSMFAAESLISTGTAQPGISLDEFQMRYSDAGITGILQQMYEINEFCELPFPQVELSEAEREKMLPLQYQLGKEVDLQLARWVIGEETLDDGSWQAYLARLDELGLSDFLTFWQGKL